MYFGTQYHLCAHSCRIDSGKCVSMANQVLSIFISFHSTPSSLSALTPGAFNFCSSCHLVVPENAGNVDAWNEKLCHNTLAFLVLCFSPIFLSAQKAFFHPAGSSLMSRRYEYPFHMFSPFSMSVTGHRMMVLFILGRSSPLYSLFFCDVSHLYPISLPSPNILLLSSKLIHTWLSFLILDTCYKILKQSKQHLQRGQAVLNTKKWLMGFQISLIIKE